VILIKLEKIDLSRTLIIFLMASLLPAAALRAQYGNIEFIENKGQWDNAVKFKGDVSSGSFFVRAGGFTVLQHKSDDWEKLTDLIHGHMHDGKPMDRRAPITLHSQSWNVDFVNANAPAMQEIIPDKALANYNNYFIGNDPTKWAGDCKIFQGITVKNVYPNVDVRYYTDKGSLKYDIIAKPGADLSRIALRYNGVNKLEVKNKTLSISTSIGEKSELMPYSYQLNGKGRQAINCKYVVRDNVVSFDIKNYDPNSTIVIDPQLIFCSFSGSATDNWGFTATYGPDGSMFGGGIAFGNGFPVSPGAFQTTYQGGTNPLPSDIVIIKLTPNGSNRVYATYIGGNGSDQPHSLVCDPSGNLVVAGRSNSSNYPLTGAAIGPGGNFDIVVTKLNATGTGIIGSKKIGGSGMDGVNITDADSGPNSLERNYGDNGRSEVILDGANNILIASSTQSSTNFPLQSAAQGSFGGGTQDAVVIKLLPDVSGLVFSTYLGGSSDDAAYVLSLDPAGNIFVGGGTASNDFPGNHTGTVGPAFHGGIADGFIAVLSNNGSTILRSTYLGTSNIDQVYGIQFDNKGFPYAMGQTLGGGWPVFNATYVNPGATQFIVKLQPDLSTFIYSTTFGKAAGSPNISPTAFLVDRCENVYVSGWGGGFGDNPSQYPYPSSGTTNLPVTPDAFKSSTDGKDFYFFVLKKNATALLFASFFGENNTFGSDHVDGGTSRFDKNGVIYQAICANCKGLDPGAVFPTTPGVWAPTNPSPGCNLAMLKIAFNLAGVGGAVQSEINGVPRDSSGCVPLTVDFTDTVQNAVTYEWNFGDGSPTITTTTPNASHTYTSIGTFTVMHVAIDSATCNIRDTTYMHIRVGDQQALLNFTATKVGPCQSFQYQFDNLSTHPPARPFNDSSFIWHFGDGSPDLKAGPLPVTHTFPAAGTYNVILELVDTAYCNAPQSDTLQLRIATNVTAIFITPSTGCAPYLASFNNTSLAGQTFSWTFGDGGTSTAINPTHLFSTPGIYQVTLTATDPNTCNRTDDTTITITVYPKPVSNFSYSPIPPTENTPIDFANLASPDATLFKWKFGDGDSLVTTSRLDVKHEYNATGTFNACLIASNPAGCADTACRQVTTLVVPAVDVPNAFTPLSGDVNSRIFVRGYGITKMQFTIWNRWGQKVFETGDRHIGWDGHFKGTLQPMDVYAYTLYVEFFDGTKASKKGDITLIR
jgi:gliding motility-associated-like protein